ncbi:hypothetical protein [Hoeflea sp. TYP-13]|uniref:hypothetical protein n=1 Tax=Hoeflea sp. TYP-13 TaxID=3230023 RepID=UPI0034C6B4CB
MIGNIKLIGGVVAGGAIGAAAVAGYFCLFAVPAARKDERRIVALEASQRAVELIRKGNEDETELDRMSVSDLCRELLGGLHDDAGDGRGGICDDQPETGDGEIHRDE